MDDLPIREADAADDIRRWRALADLSRLALEGMEPAELQARATALVEELDAVSAGAGRRKLREDVEDVCRAAHRRFETEQVLRRSEAGLAEAQRIGRMGSYDWEIDEDRNTWSDELYRIYGCEPQSFNASYERFMSFVHPDDRDAVAAVHARAFQTCEPYRLEERIVRPDGAVRLLRTWGEVVTDEYGRPVRMRGICQDVTEQRQAEEELRRSMERFETLIEATPDAVVVVDVDGVIVQANAQTEAVFGFPSQELLGQPVDILVPERLRGVHWSYRDRFMAAPRSRSMGASFELFARRKDGSEVPVEVALAALTTAQGRSVAAFVRDITERRRAEQLARDLHDVQERRRHALEINDNVVQGLVACQYLFDGGRHNDASQALAKTLASAKLMMNDLLGGDPGASLAAGALVRARPAPAFLDSHVGGPVPTASEGRLRVLLADDVADLRTTLRLALEADGRFVVVGEAGDGAAAVELAASLQPDIAIVDLAMPVMDGLEAITLIRARVPQARIIAMSGFDGPRLGSLAMRTGADAYVEKGTSLPALVNCVGELGSHASAEATPAVGASPSLATLLHELRTPLTVVQGVARTLRSGLGKLTDETVDDLLAALERSARHLTGLVDGFGDNNGLLEVTPVSLDLASVAQDVVVEVSQVAGGHTVLVDVEGATTAWADPVRVRQILANLLANAIRHTPDGTVARVQVRSTAAWAEVACEDDGPGVPSERYDELFTRGTSYGASGGSGLGLYLSRRLAEAMGGALCFEQPEAGGSRFVLRLPASGPGAARGVGVADESFEGTPHPVGNREHGLRRRWSRG